MTVPFFGHFTHQKTAQLSTNVAVRLLADNLALDPTSEIFIRFPTCKTFSFSNNDEGNGNNSRAFARDQSTSTQEP